MVRLIQSPGFIQSQAPPWEELAAADCFAAAALASAILAMTEDGGALTKGGFGREGRASSCRCRRAITSANDKSMLLTLADGDADALGDGDADGELVRGRLA